MQVPCEISKKRFKTVDGKEVEYISFEIEIDGERFNLSPRKDERKLVYFVLNALPEFKKLLPL